MSANSLPFMAMMQKSTKNLVNRTVYPIAKAAIPANSWVGMDLLGEVAPITPMESVLLARQTSPAVNGGFGCVRGINDPGVIFILFQENTTVLTLQARKISDYSLIHSLTINTGSNHTSSSNHSIDITNDGGVDKFFICFKDSANSNFMFGTAAAFNGTTLTKGAKTVIDSFDCTSTKVQTIGGKYFWLCNGATNYTRIIKLDLSVDFSIGPVVTGLSAPAYLVHGSLSPSVLLVSDTGTRTHTMTLNTDTAVATIVNTYATASSGSSNGFVMDDSDPTNVLVWNGLRFGRWNMVANTYANVVTPSIDNGTYFTTAGAKTTIASLRTNRMFPISRRHFVYLTSQSSSDVGLYNERIYGLKADNTVALVRNIVNHAYTSATDQLSLGSIQGFAANGMTSLFAGGSTTTDGVTSSQFILFPRSYNQLYGFCKDGAAKGAQATVILSGVIEGTNLPTGKFFIVPGGVLATLPNNVAGSCVIGPEFKDWRYLSRNKEAVVLGVGAAGSLTLTSIDEQLKAEA